jgi:hypothetical protein
LRHQGYLTGKELIWPVNRERATMAYKRIIATTAINRITATTAFNRITATTAISQ